MLQEPGLVIYCVTSELDELLVQFREDLIKFDSHFMSIGRSEIGLRALIMPKRSPYRNLMDFGLMKIYEKGVMDALDKRTKVPPGKVRQGDPKVLTILDTFVIFLIFACTLLISIFILFYELIRLR
jgi:hypothetical protein